MFCPIFCVSFYHGLSILEANRQLLLLFLVGFRLFVTVVFLVNFNFNFWGIGVSICTRAH